MEDARFLNSEVVMTQP